jgi:hypothetical protein
MASKPKSFRVDEKKQTIVLYTNVERPKAEDMLVQFYLKQGFKALVEEKKKGKTVSQMKKEMKGTEALKEFEKAYESEGGFFEACKIYNKWKKENK